MEKFEFKKLLPYVLAIAIFAVMSMIFFYPVLEGYTIRQSDIKLGKGMSKEVTSHREKFAEEPLWVGNMFSGMPAYLISTRHDGNLIQYISKITKLGLPHPIGIVFAYMIGFFIFSLALRINPWISIIGAIAYGLSSYFIIILEAGHNTKALALAYLPPMLAGIVITYRRKETVGLVLFSIFLGLELFANHYQITYYSILIALGIVVVMFIDHFKHGKIKDFVRKSIFLLFGALLAIGSNTGNMLTTYEYAKESIRGKSELTISPDGQSNQKVKSSGLDKDYITQWSYGKSESLSLFLPKVKGGGSGAIISSEEEVRRLQREDRDFFNFLARQYREQGNIVSTYWGNQPFTSGPVYVGVIVFLLAILSLLFVKDKLVVALGIISILALMLSWGKNFMGLTEFFIDYIPMYNKFRAVTTLLIILEFTIPVLGVLFLSKLYNEREKIFEERSKLIVTISSFVFILLVLFLSPDSFLDFISDKEEAQFAQQMSTNPQQARFIENGVAALIDYRIEVVKSDVVRSLQFLIIFIIVIGLYLFKKLNRTISFLMIGSLITVDLWTINKEYFNNETTPRTSKGAPNRYLAYQLSLEQKAPYQAGAVDYAILNNELKQNPQIKANIDNALSEGKRKKRRLAKQEVETIQFDELMRGTHYRVLNTTSKMDEDASTAYFHKTLAGYHPAKMKKYQELIDFKLGIEHYQLRQAFSKGGREMVKTYLPQMNMTNMLNAKYVIGVENTTQGQQLTYVENPNRLGNAWFVSEVKFVENADEEILAVRELNPRTTAIVRDDEKVSINSTYSPSTNDIIQLDSYLPNKLVYSYSTVSNQLAVFSEVYYSKGWKVYVNGEESDFFKVNYLLRGMKVPKGSGQIVFKFEPQSFIIGNRISLASSALIILLALGLIVKYIKEYNKRTERPKEAV